MLCAAKLYIYLIGTCKKPNLSLQTSLNHTADWCNEAGKEDQDVAVAANHQVWGRGNDVVSQMVGCDLKGGQCQGVRRRVVQ